MHNFTMEHLKGIAFFILCIVWQAHGAVNCTALGSGRHADPADTTCQAYVYCIVDTSTNNYVSYNYTCPNTSLFNPNTGQCTNASNYTCPGNMTTNSTVCTEDGFVADPTSTNCSSYIQCTLISGEFIETLLNCPMGTFYDPATTLCESDYNCTTKFTCNAAGRFAETTDTTCQTYYLCVFFSFNSTYGQYQYNCPGTSVFNPNSKVCTTSYTCGS